MSVLYVSDVYFPRVNGVSTSIGTVRRHLPSCGIDVPLVAPRYGGEKPERGVTRVEGVRVPFDPEDRFVGARRLERAGAALEFGLVHAQTPFAAHRAGVRLARARGVPLVETWHTDFEHYFEHYVRFVPKGFARATARRLARRVARDVDHLVVPSRAIADGLAAQGVTTPHSVVPTGVSSLELGSGDGLRFRAAHGIGVGRKVAVHVGRVAHEKNIGFLLDVVADLRQRLPEVLLVIAGEGPAKRDLERRVAERNLRANVLFVGYLDRAHGLADAYRAGDCFAFASLTETQGLVLLEAMSLGVPVVSLAAQGTLDLLSAPGSETRGALVPRHDVADFSAALERVLRDDELAARLASEGRARAAEWSPERCAGRLAALYRELAATSARVAATTR